VFTDANERESSQSALLFFPADASLGISKVCLLEMTKVCHTEYRGQIPRVVVGHQCMAGPATTCYGGMRHVILPPDAAAAWPTVANGS
jgi:hypothetical protein